MFAERKRCAGRYLTLVYGAPHTGVARVGLAIAKKQVQRAHERQRIKRIVRETFRTCDQIAPRDFVVLARTSAISASNAQLRHEFLELLAKVVSASEQSPAISGQFVPQS